VSGVGRLTDVIRRESLNWTVATAIGAAGIVVVTVGCWLLPDGVPAEVPALLTLVPITAASVLGGWRVGLPLAILGAVVHALAFIHPVGTVTFGYSQDIAVLLTFTAVAAVVSILVSRRSIANHAELIGRERMVLLRSVSHDLRNPLHSVLAASTELLEGGDHEPATRERLLGLVIGETERLDRIVTNILSLSRLQAGALIPERQAISLAEVVERCRERFTRLDERVTIAMSLTADVEIDVDPVQIDQVLTNLIENAIRHSTGPVTVVIESSIPDRADPPLVEVTVSDDGPGFPPDSLMRPPSAFRSANGSWGLGLTVCEAIVIAHGGSLEIGHRRGGGARVGFTIPLAP
jgi:K+-sensing histidine kinase KdpD